MKFPPHTTIQNDQRRRFFVLVAPAFSRITEFLRFRGLYVISSLATTLKAPVYQADFGGLKSGSVQVTAATQVGRLRRTHVRDR